MKILVCGINYLPEVTGVGKYTGEMCEWLAAQGHQVEVVTAPPYYPAWKIADDYVGGYRREERNGVVVNRCPIWVPAKPSGLKRIIHLASFAAMFLPVAFRRSIAMRPDVVISIAPTIFSAIGARAAAGAVGAKSWLHIQDFEVDAAFELGIFSSRAMRKLISLAETAVYRAFDRVSSITPAMVDQIGLRSVEMSRAVLFPNWVDTESVVPDRAAGRAFREELGLPIDRTLALYSGNMGEKQGLDVIIDAAKLLINQPLHFLICGDGPAKQRLVEAAADMPQVSFLPLQPIEKLNALLNSADIHLLPQRAGAADLVMPSKLTGILSCGGTVIATADPGTNLAQVVEGVGSIACKPEEPQALAEALMTFLREPARLAESGTRARQYAEDHLSRNAVLAQFRDQICELTNAI